jgi:hypothetical protein
MLLSFKDFLNEASLVTGKIDLNTLAKLIKLGAQYGVDHPETIQGRVFQMYEVELKGNLIRVCFEFNKRGNLMSASYQGEHSKDQYTSLGKSPSKKFKFFTLSFTEKVLEFDEFGIEIFLSHEFSHILDKGLDAEDMPITRHRGKAVEKRDDDDFTFFHNPVFRKKQFKTKTLDDKLKLIEDYMADILSMPPEVRQTDPKFISWYMRKETEVEAHVGMIDYAVNLLLQKNPEKAEALKVLLRKGDMDLKQVFPELATMDRFMERMMKFEKIRKKLQKRLVVTLSSVEAAKEPMVISLAGYFELENGKLKVPDGKKFLEEYKKIVS